MNINAELEAVNATTSITDAVNKLFEVYNGQGHSGGSHSVLISWLRAWCYDLTPVIEEGGLLTPYSDVLFSIVDPVERATALDYFNRLVDNEVLSPLTGEDNEWIDHGPGNGLQNRRMGSVFKDPNSSIAYYIDGRSFARLYPDLTGWVGYHNHYSRTDITFPWLPPKKSERVYFVDPFSEVGLPAHVNSSDYQLVHYIKLCAGYREGSYIHPESFFIKPEDKELLIEHFNDVTKKLSNWSHDTKLLLLRNLMEQTWTEEEELDADSILELQRELSGVYIFRRLLYPLIRLFACIPETAKLSNGVYYGYLDSIHAPRFDTPECPSKHYQDWVPMKGRWAGHLAVSLGQYREGSNQWKDHDPTIYFDRVGFEIKMIGGNDNYLYTMRRRFKLKHPKTKQYVSHAKTKQSE